MLAKDEEKTIKSVSDPDALPESEEEKAKVEKQAEESKGVLDFVKETWGTRSRRPVCPRF